MDEDPNYSVVDYMSDHSGYRCGYCKSSDTNYSKGMWAHRMSVGNYQDLIDRGWRRSGKYCYKPTMDMTCCPSYTIRCDTLNYRPSKSQKKVLKRMHNFLSHGSTKANHPGKDKLDSPEEAGGGCCVKEEIKEVTPRAPLKEDFTTIQASLSRLKAKPPPELESASHPDPPREKPNYLKEEKKASHPLFENDSTQKICPISGPDPAKPPCKKAKLIRREKYEAKKTTQKSLKHSNRPKSLEDYINEPLPANPAHRLELRLVCSEPPSKKFNETLLATHSVYQSYQMKIHKDPLEKCATRHYKRFLCHSPLQHWKPSCGPPHGYGSFHQQYWLDNRLIAVGVLDVLPNAVSSVYLYYDPEFSFLSLGTYATLREIALTRELSSSIPSLHWYYMGFYIHSCPKMRYKGGYHPSYLLCPETYSWVEIRECVQKLDKSKFSRLNEESQAIDTKGIINIKKVLCLCGGSTMHYGNYQMLKRRSNSEDEQVKEYAALTGSSCCYSMLLYRE